MTRFWVASTATGLLLVVLASVSRAQFDEPAHCVGEIARWENTTIPAAEVYYIEQRNCAGADQIILGDSDNPESSTLWGRYDALGFSDPFFEDYLIEIGDNLAAAIQFYDAAKAILNDPFQDPTVEKKVEKARSKIYKPNGELKDPLYRDHLKCHAYLYEAEGLYSDAENSYSNRMYQGDTWHWLAEDMLEYAEEWLQELEAQCFPPSGP